MGLKQRNRAALQPLRPTGRRDDGQSWRRLREKKKSTRLPNRNGREWMGG
ncbi:MAG: hypothetical protein IPL78_21260 [Chloroflexi bacterium]|nr:hypothetical protein [Chloroflexota bacterium]